MKKTLLSALLLGAFAAVSAGAFVILGQEQIDDQASSTPPDTLRERGAL